MRVAIQFEKNGELDSLKEKLKIKYPGEKPRFLYAKALIAGMKILLGEIK